MKCDPADAAPPFNLGNICALPGRKVEAEAAFRAATRADRTFAEAWYILSDLLDEHGRAEGAIDCLRRALEAAMPTRCLILRYYFSETTSTRRP
jgi:tetratricopeptide (TPR) repeat protein